ncbi:hypothetical protein ADUPG1_009645 [Aduncisulcus paluster]|uniref:Uncharacterized protein n=1 Tax=Aduncisulcus paluster TaxID=2918883 RepID=A0ABQ5KWB1_9EUKA|nr:hypothetical protein ADUPG1_009645 [Aduncisulcus paluster]
MPRIENTLNQSETPLTKATYIGETIDGESSKFIDCLSPETLSAISFCPEKEVIKFYKSHDEVLPLLDASPESSLQIRELTFVPPKLTFVGGLLLHFAGGSHFPVSVHLRLFTTNGIYTTNVSFENEDGWHEIPCDCYNVFKIAICLNYTYSGEAEMKLFGIRMTSSTSLKYPMTCNLVAFAEGEEEEEEEEDFGSAGFEEMDEFEDEM